MAEINFFNDNISISTSGLGFFGASGFGSSVAVGAYQDSTYVTDGNGSVNAGQADNVKWTHPNSGNVNGAGSVNLLGIANKDATLNVRFTHSSAVTIENAFLRIYDRTSANNPASGVLTKAAEIIHPWPAASPNGSGDTSWVTPTGSSVKLGLVNSPGMSGVNAMADNSDTRHDWYVAISASPNSIGSKNLYGVYVELEYL